MIARTMPGQRTEQEHFRRRRSLVTSPASTEPTIAVGLKTAQRAATLCSVVQWQDVGEFTKRKALEEEAFWAAAVRDLEDQRFEAQDAAHDATEAPGGYSFARDAEAWVFMLLVVLMVSGGFLWMRAAGLVGG